jgi:hypothetical protein
MPTKELFAWAMPVVAAAIWCINVGLARTEDRVGTLEISVLDKQSGEAVPSRIHLRDENGAPQKAKALPFWHDHFVCPGRVTLDLPAGDYGFEIERGPEYSRGVGTATVSHLDRKALIVDLTRLADLPAEGWWPGDLHVHRPTDDIELLMRAEDLHVAPVITWWNDTNLWANRTLPAQPLVRWVHERMGRIRLDDAHQREEVIQYHRAAEEFWRAKVAAADAE